MRLSLNLRDRWLADLSVLVRLGTMALLGQAFSTVLSGCQIDFVWLFIAAECAILCATNLKYRYKHCKY
jgi:hypothetical protein